MRLHMLALRSPITSFPLEYSACSPPLRTFFVLCSATSESVNSFVSDMVAMYSEVKDGSITDLRKGSVTLNVCEAVKAELVNQGFKDAVN